MGVSVVGIGADGWDGLGAAAQAAILEAEEIIGSARQLALLPPQATAATRAWPSPMAPLLDELAGRADGGPMCVLASGDPMLHGIGATLARRLGPARICVHPQPSAFALACARLGWPAAEVELVSAVARAPEVVAPALAPGRRIVAYVTGADGAAQVARVLRERGYGPSRLVVLEHLGALDERIIDTTAGAWDAAADPLHTVALECAATAGAALLARTPGLPDDAYDHDGQLTKRHVRALTLAALVPLPGQLLWDVGAGAGSIAIEWLRAAPGARAIAVEQHAERAARAAANALRLGVPQLDVRIGRAPARPRRAARARRDLRRRRARRARTRRALLERPAARRADRRQRRDARGRADARRRARGPRRRPGPHRDRPRAAARRLHLVGRASGPSCSGRRAGDGRTSSAPARAPPTC